MVASGARNLPERSGRTRTRGASPPPTLASRRDTASLWITLHPIPGRTMATATPPPAAATEPAPAPDLKILWIRVALFVAIIGVLGSLHLSINMGLQACRCATISALHDGRSGHTVVRHVPAGRAKRAVSVAGARARAAPCIAATHVQLRWNGTLECPNGISGFLPVPQETWLFSYFSLAR